MKQRVSISAAFILLTGILCCGICEAIDIKTSQGAGADTYLNFWNKTGNYGAQSDLTISKNYVSYVKFDLSSIGTNDITDANLALYGTPYPAEPPVTKDFAVFGLIDGSDEWGESTINYNNAPVITNPITWHPLLVYLGRIYYTAGNESAIFMTHTGGKPLISFLNSRGPDGLVTIIISSDAYTEYEYFSTKEDHGDASEAPYLSITVNPAVVQRNNWTGTDSNSWSDPDNWLDENGIASIPDSNAVVNLVSGTHYPVIIDSNSYAKKVFVHSGGLKVEAGTLAITGGILGINDGLQVNITDGRIALTGNVEGQMWGLIGKGKIITSNTCQQEVYAQYDPNLSQTIVKTRDLVRKLIWGNSIVSADGPLGYPPENGRAAQYCVDGSGMLAEAHIGFILGGTTVPNNSYYAYQLAWEEPTLKFVFDDVYTLTDMFVWNYELGYAFKKVRIEYSLDDTAYTTLLSDDANDPNFFTLLQGKKDCTKNDVISFGDVSAKYVKITAVGGPGTGNYESATSWGTYILKEIQFCHDGLKACEPNPANNFSSVDIAVDVLRWIPGKGAITGQDVWFGQTPGGMAKIGDNISPCADSISISALQSDKDYYWRVDARDAGGSPITGRLWHFRTKKWISYNPGGEGIFYAFGLKTSGGSQGYLAVNGSGMTGDIHASWLDSTGWYCKKPWDVGVNEPQLYVEFDKIYDINEMWVWNREGATAVDSWKTVQIEYSTDSVNYNILMNGSEPNFVLPRGNTDGTHDTEIQFGVPAKYVKLTAVGGIGVGNYGSTYGYKLREIRFYPDGPYTSVNAYAPEPADNSDVDIFVELGWTPGAAAATGQNIWFGRIGEPLVRIASNIDPDANSYILPQLDNLSDYKWRVDSIDGNTVTQGDEWQFSTHARLQWNPGLIGIADANGSPGDGGSQGYNAVNMSGVKYDFHYSFLSSNGWYCRKPWTLAPPLAEPQLDIIFDRIYDINEMWVWNHDGVDFSTAIPPDGEYYIAMKTIRIKYSTDGMNYTTLMNGSDPNFILPHGDPGGAHDTEINFGDVPAKYVRITAVGGPGVGNYGSTLWGYKLREVRFYYQVPLWADLNNDKKVNFKDYAIMAEDWLEENWIYVPAQYCLNKPAGDITGDCRVDYRDTDIMAGEWLEDIN